MQVALLLLAITSQAFTLKNRRLEVCDEDSSVDLTSGDHRKSEIVHNGLHYDRGEYYIDNNTGIERGCICMKRTCIRKCCPVGFGYNLKTKGCSIVDEPFEPPIWDTYAYKRVKKKATELFHYVPGKMNCTKPKQRIRVGQAVDRYVLTTDGNLYIQIPESIPPWLVRTPDEYCIDTFVMEDETGKRTSSVDALICFADKETTEKYYLSFICMLVSCIFILATVAVYAWLPELRNLHGRVLMAYLLCLFVGFIFLATMQILLTINNISMETCVYLTFVIYYSLLAAFFWLNVMCFDIWWTFSGKRGKNLENMSIRTRFVAYSLYAFGIPTILTALLIGLEFSGLPPHPLLPLIRQQGCFIYGTSKLLYLYGPISILCIANMAFFVLTAVKIAQIKRQTSVLKSKDSSTHDQQRNDRQRLLLYIKLLAVMGVSWILEVVSAIYPDAKEIWKFTDAYNVLIGVIIFVIFVCKRKIFRLIKKRIKQRFRRTENTELKEIIDSRKLQNKNQRISIDTIRTSVASDSIRNSTNV